MESNEIKLKMLKLEDLIADKNFNTAIANREIQQFGEWRSDHEGSYAYIAREIDKIFQELQEAK